MKRRFSCFFMVVLYIMVSLGVACNRETDSYKTEEYADNAGIARGGFWSPDRTEEEYKRYGEAGFNTVLLVRHGTGDYAVKNNYYLGSASTDEAIELCRKYNLKIIINYGDWEASLAGQTVNTASIETTYEHYKNSIDDGTITGMHICDEPYKNQIDDETRLANAELYENFAKYYKGKSFFVNLHPWVFFNDHGGFGMGVKSSYPEYVDYYVDNVLKKVSADSRVMSTDVYPFTKDGLESLWLPTYEVISNAALKNSSSISYYMQTQKSLEGRYSYKMTYEDMRMQVYTALCYGATQLMFYCYTCPDGWNYEYCMLDKDGNLSDYYYLVKRINEEISVFENVYASYNYVGTYPVLAEQNNDLNLQLLENKANYEQNIFLKSVSANKGVLMGKYEREGGEAYMFVNFGDTTKKENAELSFTLQNSNYVAIYGKNGAKANEKIVKGNKGNFNFTLEPGEGLFVVPLNK